MKGCQTTCDMVTKHKVGLSDIFIFFKWKVTYKGTQLKGLSNSVVSYEILMMFESMGRSFIISKRGHTLSERLYVSFIPNCWMFPWSFYVLWCNVSGLL